MKHRQLVKMGYFAPDIGLIGNSVEKYIAYLSDKRKFGCEYYGRLQIPLTIQKTFMVFSLQSLYNEINRFQMVL